MLFGEAIYLYGLTLSPRSTLCIRLASVLVARGACSADSICATSGCMYGRIVHGSLVASAADLIAGMPSVFSVPSPTAACVCSARATLLPFKSCLLLRSLQWHFWLYVCWFRVIALILKFSKSFSHPSLASEPHVIARASG